MDTKKFALKTRLNVLKMLDYMGYGHYGGSLSIVEVLSVLYNGGLNIDTNDLKNPNRDYLVLSKGHGGTALYAALAVKGILDENVLFTMNKGGTNLPSHPDMNKTPGVDMTTGSLGQGVAVATGIAYKNMTEKRNNITVAIVGDGELDEGQCWEAMQFSAYKKLDNFVVFVDYNKKQQGGNVWNSPSIKILENKLNAFGLETTIVKGNSTDLIQEIFEDMKKNKNGKPKAIILDTVKGQGVPFIEEFEDNHHIRPTEEFNKKLKEFIKDLESKLEVHQ